VAVFDVTKKAQIYHILHQFNAAFSAIVGHYQTLREIGVLSARLARLYQAFAQEVQSEFNEEFLMILHEIESEDWNRFGKVRQQWEKLLRDPDDVFIHAAERRAELERAARKKAKRKKAGLKKLGLRKQRVKKKSAAEHHRRSHSMHS
jgi:hypothetical protein